jgi:hypothetical protein
MRGLFARRNSFDARSLAEAARVSIGSSAQTGALARMFALFPDERVILVVDPAGAPVGVVTPDQVASCDERTVADVMHAIA